MNESHTAVLERQAAITGPYQTEPYEVGWANEGIFFVREHGTAARVGAHIAEVEISPDGMHWCAEGGQLTIEPGALSHVKVRHFGGWLRIRGEAPKDAELVVSVQLVLKG